MRWEQQERGLHVEGHYMGEVLHREETIRKRDYIEKRSWREVIYTERRHIQKKDYTGRKLHEKVITWGRDYTGR